MTYPSRLAMCDAGKDVVARFCTLNDLPVPKFGGAVPGRDGADCTGMYHAGTIYVNVGVTALVGCHGMCWSYPGYAIDRTGYGVYSHELGHHVDDFLRERGKKSPSTLLRASTGEKKLTNYCPDSGEWWAEMFRLFVTNPDLLSKIRPNTYAGFLGYGLVPVETRGYLDVLSGAPLRTIAMAKRRVAEASS